ncbi:MAG: hypothetical protein K6E95_03785 [Lachnospiraceae bacterium]|nr:hypothetical protein [Lachnospiraceae bacterium]
MDIPCKSVSAFTKENEYEYIKEGGLNDYVHMKRKPISKPFTFTVERYVTPSYLVDPLALGAEMILPVLLFVSRYGNDFDVISRTYTFTGCTVISKEFGSLNAEKSGLLTESVTIAYREMLVFDLPGGGIADPEYTFKENGTFINNEKDATTGVKGRAIVNSGEVRKAGMKAEKYEFVNSETKTIDGKETTIYTANKNNLRADKHGLKEKTKKEMEAAAANDYKFSRNGTFINNVKDATTGVKGRAIVNSGEVRKAGMKAEKYEFVNSKTETIDGKETTIYTANKNNLRADKHGLKEKTKEELEALAANDYKFSKDGTFINNAKGATTGVKGSAIVNANEVRKADMKAEKYEFINSATEKIDGKETTIYTANKKNVRAAKAPNDTPRPKARVWQPVKKITD